MLFLNNRRTPTTLIFQINAPTGASPIMKRTLEGTQRKRRRVSGFRVRMSSVGGRRVLARRRVKGRHRLAI